MVKQPKAILSCRISPTLKQEVERGAELEGLTTSTYVEQLIQQQSQGDHISEDREQEYLQRIEVLERRLSEAEQTRVNYEGRLDYANNELEIVTEQFGQVMEALDSSVDNEKKLKELESALSAKEETISELKSRESFNFLYGERADYSEYMENLQEKYPDATKEQIIIGSLYAAFKNEGGLVFTVTQIKNYLNNL